MITAESPIEHDCSHGNAGPAHERAWRTVNITPIERAGRMLLDAAGVVAAIVMLASASTALAAVIEVLLLLAGADLVVTGAVGHCPMYQRLGYTPNSLRRPS